jgi:hypothetical protein
VLLTEIFTSTPPYTITIQTPALFEATFTVADNEYEFSSFATSTTGQWNVSFRLRDDTKHQNPHGTTGVGREFTVFAAFGAIVSRLVTEYPITSIAYSSPSDRQRIYNHIFKKALPNWTTTPHPTVKDRYVVSRP